MNTNKDKNTTWFANLNAKLIPDILDLVGDVVVRRFTLADVERQPNDADRWNCRAESRRHRAGLARGEPAPGADRRSACAIATRWTGR